MAINPMSLMKLQERFSIFQSQHPKIMPFIRSVGGKAITPGTIIEIKVTEPDGEEHIANIKLTQEDMATIEVIKDMNKQG